MSEMLNQRIEGNSVVKRTETASGESALPNKLEGPDQFAEGCHRATYQNKS